jgi:hypothetical protein
MGWLAPEAHLLGVGNSSGSFEALDRAEHMRSRARPTEWVAPADER